MPLVAQAGVALFFVAHWVGVLHAVQISFVQMGVAPEHPALVRHATHLLVVVSQTGVAPEQVVLSMHCTQVPLAEHAGAVGLLAAHWAGVVHAVQTSFVHMGVAPEHPALVRHATHLLVAVSQTGVLPEQVLLSVHWTQVPLAEQAGAAGFLARHWAGVLQTVQTFAVQMGVAAGHPALVRHATHLLVVVSQTGVAPEQVLLSVHCTQMPVAEQAGVAEFLAAHWLASVQAVQTLAAQMGAAAGQVALDTHWTHWLVVVSQTGVLPEQVPLSVHCTQVPVAEQAGVVLLRAAH